MNAFNFMVKILLADTETNSLANLEKNYDKERDYRLRERILCIIWSIDEKISALKISKRIRRDEQSVRQWIRSYNKEGLKGLNLKLGGGRPSKLSIKEENFIISLLDKSPEDYDFVTQIWDCKILAAVFGEVHNREIHKDVVWRLLKRKGYSYKKPEVKNPKGDDELKKKQEQDSNPWKKR